LHLFSEVALMESSLLKGKELLGEALGFGGAVGDVEDGDARFMLDGSKEAGHLGSGFFVEGAEGFIEEKNGGSVGEGAAKRDALGFTATEVGDATAQEMVDAEAPGEFVDALVDGGAVPLSDGEGEGEVFADAHGGEEGAILGDIADAALSNFEVGDIAVGEKDAAGMEAAQATDGFEKGGFSTASLAHEHAVVSGGDFKIDTGDGESAGAERDIFESDHGAKPPFRRSRPIRKRER
jgi:hypothetical protein